MQLWNHPWRPAMPGSTLASLIILASPAFAQQDNDDNSSSSSSDGNSRSSSSAERTSSSARATSSTGLPTLSSSTSENAFPTLSSASNAASTSAIPTYPAPSVPPTENAPFMKHSSMPEGTVFIAVGAILGAFAIALLIWRLVVGALLAKSISRAKAAETHGPTTKKKHPPPPAQFYGYSDQQSSLSLGPGATSRTTKRATRKPSANLSQSNLFFSPTAASGNNQPGNRGSTFLPSGFYAAGASQPGHHTQSISLSNLRPESRGHYPNASRGTLNQTPPDSPYYHGRRDLSSSSISLNQPPGQQRAPSAYLDDLLTDDPSAFPPPHMAPSDRGSGRNSPAQRY